MESAALIGFDLLALHPWREIEIVTPGEYLKR